MVSVNLLYQNAIEEFAALISTFYVTECMAPGTRTVVKNNVNWSNMQSKKNIISEFK